tara:strand:- start:29 stop:217 length:189 start_codon:yes stop_codon:yes gene_type:complete
MDDHGKEGGYCLLWKIERTGADAHCIILGVDVPNYPFPRENAHCEGRAVGPYSRKVIGRNAQ